MASQKEKHAIESAKTDIGAALAAGAALAPKGVEVKVEQGIPLLIYPEGVNVIQCPDWLERPRRLQQGVTLHSADSLIDYINLYGSKDSTMVFASRSGSKIIAVLDYHESAGKPAWGSHRATFALKQTEDWVAWSQRSSTEMSQGDLGMFIEEHTRNIHTPVGLAEIVRDFEASKTGSFKSHKREEDGTVVFKYEEIVSGQTSQATLKFPTNFTLVLTPYEGQTEDQARVVTARLRYRISGSQLLLRFELENMTKHLEEAFRDVVGRVTSNTESNVKGVLFGEINS